MGFFLRVTVFVLGMIFTITVFRLLIKNKISEKNSLLWLMGAVIVFIISIFPSILDKISKLIGIDYPPSLLFLLSVLLLLFINLYHSIQISALNQQVKELAQYISIEKDNK